MRIVVDTSIFGNPEIYSMFDQDRAVSALKILSKFRELGIEVYTTPSVRKELEMFLDPSILEGLWTIRAPNLNLNIPAYAIWIYINNIKSRLDKALRLAEEYSRKGIRDEREDIKDLREKFRELVRNGILDSTTDLELVILAKELDASILTADQGIIKFAESLGCSIIYADSVKYFLDNYGLGDNR
ncbi:MAG: RNA ligase partner protein [Candidatus Anstonellales archaeon]